MASDRINVLIVDDSAVHRLLLAHVLESDPCIHVIGNVADGQAGLQFVARAHPDLVIMDVNMPGLDGIEVTRQIMVTTPVPIIICTAAGNARSAELSIRALDAGALTCVEKPVSPLHPGFDSAAAKLLQTVKLMAEIPVVRRRTKTHQSRAGPAVPVQAAPRAMPIRCIGIGASTGGPAILHTIFSALPREFPVPILLVQHILPGFLTGLVSWLNQVSPLRVEIAASGISALPGRIYVAPDDHHLIIERGGTLRLSHEAPENGHRPSVSRLFRSMADSLGSNAVGVLLTGMGRDGSAELKLLRERGALTIVQDLESSVVPGMPGEAIALGAAAQVLPPARIVQALRWVVVRGVAGEVCR